MHYVSIDEQVGFLPINPGYDRTFKQGQLSLGLVVPIENYNNASAPTMAQHAERVQLAEALGFSAIWLRDVPFNVPSFGDAGQTFDPFTYLGFLAAQTKHIALGVASVILPLRHPAHVAKAAASADRLSGGRVILGIASGDRPEEYPALNRSYHDRGERFRESVDYIQRMGEDRPVFNNAYGQVHQGLDMLPKPAYGKLPLLITGASQQDQKWLANNGDGWMTYPRPSSQQQKVINDLRAGINASNVYDKPVMEPLYIDLVDSPNVQPTPIHLGMRLGITHLREYLKERREIGVNHVALNLRFNQNDIEKTLNRLAKEILPDFTY